MNPPSTQTGSHPSLAALALFSRGDLPWPERMRVRWHVSRCAACRSEADDFRTAAANLRQDVRSQTLPGYESRWALVEREMLGNIAVGLAAARCIDNVGRRRALSRTGWLVTAMAALFVIGWFMHIPAEQDARLLSSLKRAFTRTPLIQSTELKSTPDGIEVKTQGATLTLMHPSSAIVALSGSSAVTARFVDEETGQVTITKVYAQ